MTGDRLPVTTFMLMAARESVVPVPAGAIPADSCLFHACSGVKQLLRQHFPEAFAQAQAQAQAQAHEGQARAVSDSL